MDGIWDAGTIDIFGIDHAMNITVLALEGVFDTGLAIVLDALSTANELAAMHGWSNPPFTVSVASTRRRVKSSQRLSVPVLPLAECPQPDLVIVPALGYKMPEALQEALARADVVEACEALRAWAAAGVRIAAACIGTFVLAESGLLDQHDATTTWWLAPLFRQRYPAVRLDTSHMIVNAGPFVTAGAALSHIDMTLWLIRQSSPELAALVARYLVVDSRPSQSVYIISDHLAHSDPLVERFDRWARQHMTEGFNLELAASALATSKRTLARRIHEVLGKTPVTYVQDLRIEQAVHLLKTSSNSVDRIANLVGYADGVTLRTLLRRRLGKGIREIRSA
ncbi:Transcriptional regulator GlxA family, contains an amidase domain and an AraC-type DNA-binding HTH domain [Paraburkholderia phenazinium]|uniref:Transcriptional regulator GlxA family, contains an amidase domain and an AraC-type DNA-binding HTH domain n=2 Tax=Paraburkholderia phenazinium TaxID=60549 RepID=A0A1G8GXS2_9BURK|nr:Transcriptional regulator GlxA family, contains an amidase domain and an AraC-type DNA-binding HTH domain [Paraburkholderia phenazinium]